MANENQQVMVDEEGSRYVMGTETVQGREVPCKMPVVHKCPVCEFEWPDVLIPSEVKALEAGGGCPDCREGQTLVCDQVGDVEYRSVP